MKKDKLTSLRHIKTINGERRIYKVFAKNQTNLGCDYLYYKEGTIEIKVDRSKCSSVQDIDKETKKLKKNYFEEEIVYGVNDFGYPNEYWN